MSNASQSANPRFLFTHPIKKLFDTHAGFSLLQMLPFQRLTYLLTFSFPVKQCTKHGGKPCKASYRRKTCRGNPGRMVSGHTGDATR